MITETNSFLIFEMFETAWLLIYTLLICTCSYISFKGLVYYFKFKLKYYLVISATLWIISVFFILWHQNLLPKYFNDYILLTITSVVVIMGIIFASSLGEDSKLRAVGKLLKSLPLKDRIFLKFPKDVNLESLSITHKRKISPYEMVAEILILNSAFVSTSFALFFMVIISVGFPVF